MGFTDLVSDAGLTGMLLKIPRPLQTPPLTQSSPEQLAADSLLRCRVCQIPMRFFLPSASKMRTIWSVLKRRLKTPPNDYFQSQLVATLIDAPRLLHFSRYDLPSLSLTTSPQLYSIPGRCCHLQDPQGAACCCKIPSRIPLVQPRQVLRCRLLHPAR
jgi:hypothetical protein